MTKRDFPPIHPGEILFEDFLKPMQISQYHLAQAIGVPPRRINEIVHGKRGVTADTALRLGRFFGMEASNSGWILTSRWPPITAIAAESYVTLSALSVSIWRP